MYMLQVKNILVEIFQPSWVDSQFSLSPNPNSLIIRARRQKKLGINLL